NDSSPTNFYTLSLHDALPILKVSLRSLPCKFCSFHYALEFGVGHVPGSGPQSAVRVCPDLRGITNYLGCVEEPVPDQLGRLYDRSEEHTSELQSLAYLVCRLL